MFVFKFMDLFRFYISSVLDLDKVLYLKCSYKFKWYDIRVINPNYNQYLDYKPYIKN